MDVGTGDATRRGPLTPVELALAAVLSAVAVVLVVLGALVPYLSTQWLAAVPLAALAARSRWRTLVAALASGCAVGFVLGGSGIVLGVCYAGFVGGVVGGVRRRGGGLGRLLLASLVIAPACAGLVDLLLLIFGSSRRLIIDTGRSTGRGIGNVVARVPGLADIGADIRSATDAVMGQWAITVAVLVCISLPCAFVAVWTVLEPVLARLSWVGAHQVVPPVVEDGEPGPLPLRLQGVRFRYPGAAAEALAGIDLELPAGQFVAVVGSNGSGKSTLIRIAAGLPPTGGRVERPGGAGLGRAGGTALILQRPDTQVLGARCGDDVVWGLPDPDAVDVDGLLATVGLTGFGDRSTASLSGGQLQRLAIAAALARRPALIISDESTAMVDPPGRRQLVDVLAQLPQRTGISVLHVTHDPTESARADRVVELHAGRVVADGPPRLEPPPAPRASAPLSGAPSGDPVLRLGDVSHVYAARTAWEHTALQGIDLDVGRGEGILLVGDNGSGKSTLAWILAGLLRPTGGTCRLRGRDVHRVRGSVALSFQHARLQLQRATVAADIAEAGGWERAAGPRARFVADALRRVGLDPELAGRDIDALSGGQQRRVALAGLLAGGPDVLVLDEPLAGVDATARRTLLDALLRLRAEGLTVLVISHDTTGLDELCPRVLRLADGRLVPAAATVPA